MTTYELGITILGMAIILYATRIGGILLAGRIPDSSPLIVWIDQLPAVTLAALVAPAAVHAGWPGIAVGAMTWLVARRSGNVLLAMVVGVVAIAVLRQLM